MMVVEASTVANGLGDGELLWMRTRVKESWIDFGAVAGKCDCSLFNSAMAREKKVCRRKKTKLLSSRIVDCLFLGLHTHSLKGYPFYSN